MQEPGLVVVGLNHKTASLVERERLRTPGLMEELIAGLCPAYAREVVELSTCNRTEIYVVTSQPSDVTGKIATVLGEQNIYSYQDEDAVSHVFRVVSGLDSMLMGEYDVVNQVKSAYSRAVESGTVGPVLHRLFQSSFRVSKAVRSKTKIGTGMTSLAKAAITLAKRTAQLNNVYVIGAGEMAERIGNYLQEEKPANVVFLNRTHDKAKHLADKYGSEALPLDRLPDVMTIGAVIIVTTAADSYVITRDDLVSAEGLTIVDLAVPRNVEPEVGALASVTLYDLDHLQRFLNTLQADDEKISVAEKIIAGESSLMAEWVYRRFDKANLVGPPGFEPGTNRL